MARGINKVILIGHLGHSPQTKDLPNGEKIVSISLATSESWKDKTTGEKQEKTEWHKIKFFRKLAEIAAQYLNKGSRIYIEGSLQTRKYKGKDGVEKYTTEIIANELQLLDSKSENTYENSNQYNQPVATNNLFQEDEDVPF